jgi:hypothetical protein
MKKTIGKDKLDICPTPGLNGERVNHLNKFFFNISYN